jgi:hypothetical protein
VTPLGTKHVIYDYYDEIELCMREVMRGYIDRREFLEVRCMSGKRCLNPGSHSWIMGDSHVKSQEQTAQGWTGAASPLVAVSACTAGPSCS